MTQDPANQSSADPDTPKHDEPVRVRRFVEASPETVFGVIATPEGFSAWMDGEAEFEAVAGSPFVVRFPRHSTVVSGTVLEVVPPQRLVVTWGIAEGPQAEWFQAGSSTVTLELSPRDGGTDVTLTHASLPKEEEVTQHEAGWRFHLSRLQLSANRAQLERPLAASWEAWCAAWTEADATRRDALLAQCCVEDLLYADDYTTVDTRSDLSVHISGTLRFVAYDQLTSTGPIRICRGEVLIPWSGQCEDGTVAFSGTLCARVSPDGEFRTITNFWDPWEPA